MLPGPQETNFILVKQFHACFVGVGPSDRKCTVIFEDSTRPPERVNIHSLDIFLTVDEERPLLPPARTGTLVCLDVCLTWRCSGRFDARSRLVAERLASGALDMLTNQGKHLALAEAAVCLVRLCSWLARPPFARLHPQVPGFHLVSLPLSLSLVLVSGFRRALHLGHPRSRGVAMLRERERERESSRRCFCCGLREGCDIHLRSIPGLSDPVRS